MRLASHSGQTSPPQTTHAVGGAQSHIRLVQSSQKVRSTQWSQTSCSIPWSWSSTNCTNCSSSSSSSSSIVVVVVVVVVVVCVAACTTTTTILLLRSSSSSSRSGSSSSLAVVCHRTTLGLLAGNTLVLYLLAAATEVDLVAVVAVLGRTAAARGAQGLVCRYTGVVW